MKLELKALQKEIKKWRNILKIEPQWIINAYIRETIEEMSEGNDDALACIVVDLRYFVATIEFNAAKIEDDDDIGSIILHELLHIIIEPLSCSSGCGLGKKFEEMNSILCESTIERLMPGYLYLYNKAFRKNKK
jgi:phosphoglycerate-specific signal transduction histidine kinase